MSQPQNQIVIYQPDETLRIDVRLENETVWLTQVRMGELFGVDRSVINRHIRNIYATAELLEGATCAKIAQVQKRVEGWSTASSHTTTSMSSSPSAIASTPRRPRISGFGPPGF